jgi:hypothetical protein
MTVEVLAERLAAHERTHEALALAVILARQELSNALILARDEATMHREMAANALALRLEGMNNFREQMAENEKDFMSKLQFEEYVKSSEVRFRAMDRFVWSVAGGGAVISILFAVVSLVVGYLRH